MSGEKLKRIAKKRSVECGYEVTEKQFLKNGCESLDGETCECNMCTCAFIVEEKSDDVLKCVGGFTEDNYGDCDYDYHGVCMLSGEPCEYSDEGDAD